MTVTGRSIALALAGLALLATAAFGGEAEDAARRAFDDSITARAAYQDAAVRAKADPSVRPEMARMRDAYTASNNAFRDAFLAADWDAFDPAKDAAMLEQGLAVSGRYLTETDPVRAIHAFDMILERLPNSSSVRMARTFMPYAYIEAGDFVGAVERIERMAAGLEGADLAKLLVTQGDLQAAVGTLDAARATYERAAAAVAGEIEDPRDPRARAQSDAAMRLALVGRPAPEIASDAWIGGESRPLSALRGKVVVVDFWATWCPPCRGVMPGLDELYAAHRDAGLEVLGVTRFYASGFLPESAAEVHKGERVGGMTEETFPAHLAEFKKRLDIAYPFVIGQQADFETYQISGIPTLVVIDRDGKIAMVKVGGGGERMLASVVKRLLAKSAD